MNDERVWQFERSLWTGDADHYRKCIDEDCLMVLPDEPHVIQGGEAIEAVAHTPRWREVELENGHIVRPQEGLIVVAYTAHARKEDGEAYTAHCTSTYRRVRHEEWQVVQHQQTPPLLV